MRYFIFLFSFLFLQCSSNNEAEMAEKSFGDEIEFQDNLDSFQSAESKEANEFELEKGSKIIKIGQLKFEVANLKESKSRVDAILQPLNAYYEDEQFNAYGSSKNYSLKIRVPNQYFDTLVYIIEQGRGELVSKNISAKDVTEDYVDLKIRLDNNLAYLKQYNELLKKASTIKDILEIQEKTRRIEAEIEAKKGKLKYLDDKVKYSTLQLEFTELVLFKKKSNNFFNSVTQAFNNGFQSFLSFLIFIINLWPFLIIIVLFWRFRKSLFGIIKRKK